jgi:FAD/FMN-containing dehydrogenase
MSAVTERIAAEIGAKRIVTGDARGHAWNEDLGRNPLGEPVAWVRPTSTDEVAAVVRIARQTRTPVVPAHRRTTYWRPLAFGQAIVLDIARLDDVGAVDTSARTVRCGAGASVRAIDDVMRATGHTLTAWPDAYGDTSLGAMIATAFTSGIGMGLADANDIVTGLTAVLGTGEIVRAGAGEVLGAGGFERPGLPDLAGLLFGSEGGLGIVTEVVVRARPRAYRAKLSFDAPGLAECLAIGSELRVPGLYESFRCVEHNGAEADVEITLTSPISRDELDGRIAYVRRAIGSRAKNLEALIEDPDGDDIPRFCGEADEHWAHLRAGRFCGVDAIVPYSSAAAALAATQSVMARARAVSHLDARRALYFAPDYVNLGLHWMLDGDIDQATVDRIVEVGIEDLAALPVIPYRWGRVWSVMSDKLDPGYRDAIRAVKRTFDPDDIMNPGVSVFGVKP